LLATTPTKQISLNFLSALGKGPAFQSGYLDDIRLTPDTRTNAILVSAPPKSMDLLLTLIKEMDVPPSARAEINVHTLKKADALETAATIQQLFLGTSTVGGGGGVPGGVPGGGGGIPGLPGGGGGFPGTTGLLGQAGMRPLAITIEGISPEGLPL